MKMCLAVLLLVSFSSKVFAWGNEGHAIVAQIAEDHLLPKTKIAIQKILPNTKLSSIASWADIVKNNNEYAHTKTWHFVNLNDDEDYEHSVHDPEGDVVTAITEMTETLKNPRSTDAEKEAALKFIVHFVGDIHQPLHAGRADDRGGNDIRVMFRGRQTNLHALWDSGIINTQKMDFSAYARSLQIQKINYDIPGFSFSKVIEEDMSLRKMMYDFNPSSRGIPNLEQAYVDANMAALNNRLLMGGMRLAELLNTIFN